MQLSICGQFKEHFTKNYGGLRKHAISLCVTRHNHNHAGNDLRSIYSVFYSIMVEVTSQNFAKLLPGIQRIIKESCFVSIDTEFTGLAIDYVHSFSLFDTMEERFHKLKSLANHFLICQIGISAFVKDDKTNTYTAHSYNFHLFPSVCGAFDRRFSMQASNIEFLKKHNFDFNKFIYQGIPYLNNEQEEAFSRKKNDLGFTHVFRDLVKNKKPLIGHNMLVDLCLMYENFHKSLPSSYEEFKHNMHQLFPIIIDTKQLSFQLKKPLGKDGLLEFNSLPELYDALTSNKGKSIVLFTPDVIHAHDCKRYNSGNNFFHEAGFDAFCVGFVFLKLAHLVAMHGIKSSEARPVPFSNYLKLLEYLVNKVNVIRGPVPYMDLDGDDPVASRPQWIVVTTRDGSALNSDTLSKNMEDYISMDIRQISSHKIIIAVPSHKKAEKIMEHLEGHNLLHGRWYSWIWDSPSGNEIIWWTVLLAGSAGIIGITTTLLWRWNLI